jgi:hypothetical protein
MDVLGGRLYVRPLVATQLPILNGLQVGATGVVDTSTPTPITVFGADAMLPILVVKDVASLAAFTDVASIQAKSLGFMVGVGGRLFNFVTYGLQFRALGPGFTPVYFGPAYDLARTTQYTDAMSPTATGSTLGVSAQAGTSFLDDKIVFRVGLDAPFLTGETDPRLSLPHLRGVISLAEGVIPGITFDFTYDKAAISSWADLVTAQDSIIKAQLNFTTGGAVISFIYNIVYDPLQTPNPWNVTSGLQSSIALF